MESRKNKGRVLGFGVTVVCMASIASAATIGWWSMDGTPGQAANLGDTFLNRTDPDVLPVYTNAFALPPLNGGVRAHGTPNYLASLFIDGSWKSTSDALGGPLVYNDDEPLLIDGSSITSWQFRGCVDEARLSDMVIQSGGSWIESAMADGETVGWFAFDGDFSSRVWNDYWTVAPVASARTGGTVPTFVDDRPRPSLLDGEGKVLVRQNAGSLDVAKGQVLWAKIPPIMAAATDGLTVELFFKGNPDAWASIIRTDGERL